MIKRIKTKTMAPSTSYIQPRGLRTEVMNSADAFSTIL